jgi:hypothetical protein
MGMCLDGFGKMAVEVRRESFIVHPTYGYKGEDDEEHDDSSTFLTRWRESVHPEFLLADLDDLIRALEEAREYLATRKTSR